MNNGVSGPVCVQSTGVEAVGSNAAHTSTQSAGVETPPAAPPAKQEEEVGAESVPASTFATAHEVDQLMASPIVLESVPPATELGDAPDNLLGKAWGAPRGSV